MGRQISFVVTFDLPRNATAAEARGYVKDSVAACCGGLHPEEPMFELDRASVKVHRLPVETK